jgi:hypothetical protein
MFSRPNYGLRMKSAASRYFYIALRRAIATDSSSEKFFPKKEGGTKAGNVIRAYKQPIISRDVVRRYVRGTESGGAFLRQAGGCPSLHPGCQFDHVRARAA